MLVDGGVEITSVKSKLNANSSSCSISGSSRHAVPLMRKIASRHALPFRKASVTATTRILKITRASTQPCDIDTES